MAHKNPYISLPSSSTSTINYTPSSITSPSSPCEDSLSKFGATIAYNGFSYTFKTVDERLYEKIIRYRAEYLFLLNSPDYTRESKPTSQVALVLRFIQYLMDSHQSASEISPILSIFQQDFLHLTDIHNLILNLSDGLKAAPNLLRTYFEATSYCSMTHQSPPSALISAAHHGLARLVIIFGGQGIGNLTCLNELRTLYSAYRPILQRLVDIASKTLLELSSSSWASDFYRGRPFDLASWLEDPHSAPDPQVISYAAFSFPLVGILSFAHYCVLCCSLCKTPGELLEVLHGITGHSQGLIAAAALSQAEDWNSFYEKLEEAVSLLFSIGLESHRHSPRTIITPAELADSIDNGEGRPSNLLVVQGLNHSDLQNAIYKCNSFLGENEQIFLALRNSRNNYVVAGPSKSLRGLTLYLRSIKANDKDQSRIPYSKRKPVINATFLPISAPFHSLHLSSAASRIKQQTSGIHWAAEAMKIPVLHTKDGENIAERSSGIIDVLIDAVTTDFVDWPSALRSSDASHFIVFGGSKLGDLVLRNEEGEGAVVFMGCELRERRSNSLVLSKADIFNHSPHELSSSSSWYDSFRSRLRRDHNGKLLLDTQFTRLLNVPPVMVAGMTPTTTHPDFVAAISNAGYHVELAGGGYHNPGTMSKALENLASTLPTGRGITCNLIYSNPEAMRWQITLLEELSRRSFCIEGLVIGAGVPSPEIVADYIRSLGLRHIGLKPGSTDGIKNILEIADAHPNFPVLLQWTGGRGGGHHSYEDFHDPIIGLYGEIRRRNNIILVAGSGFGDAEGMYPYLTGSWAKDYGCSPMPFDAILLGSRMMVASEAHTSPQSKRLIVDSNGVTETNEWEKSYDGVAGGVLTVLSEMRQPIHKLATRGVKFWAEMDKEIFSLPKLQRKAALMRKKSYIISKLNADYAKVWFAMDDSGNPIELQDMTYLQVLRRLVSLMYVAHQARWINGTYVVLVKDFAIRTLERLLHKSTTASKIPDTPKELIAFVLESCSLSDTSKLHPEDVRWFVKRCKARGQKPVNFIPVLDDDFEYFFKKDSLWQSEDIDSVVDQDAGRVCVLQSPVSVKYSHRVDQSAKEILDEITSGLIDRILKDYYNNDPESVPSTDDSHGYLPPVQQPNNVKCIYKDATRIFHLIGNEEIDTDVWFNLLAQSTKGWMRALLLDEFLLQDQNRVESPFRRVLRLRQGESFQLDPIAEVITIMEVKTGRVVCSVSLQNDCVARLQLSVPSQTRTTSLNLDFEYRPDGGDLHFYHNSSKRMEKVTAFYRSLWLNLPDHGSDNHQSDNNRRIFARKDITVSEDMVYNLSTVMQTALADPNFCFATHGAAPLDVGIVLVWEVLVAPLFEIEADLTKLVHLSNRFERCSGTAPLCVGETVRASAELRALKIEDHGKSMTVQATIYREETAVAIITSTFFIKGSFTDFHSMFRINEEPAIVLDIPTRLDQAILVDREWISFDPHYKPLQGDTMVFRISTVTTWKSKNVISKIKNRGMVFHRSELGIEEHVGSIDYECVEPKENPVLEFLHRKGRPQTEIKHLKTPGWHSESTRIINMPTSNEPYAVFSHDVNPIHLCAPFAALAGLPGTISHGMATSAITRAILLQYAADGVEERFRSFSASFLGMIIPGDALRVTFSHYAMKSGLMLIKFWVRKEADDQLVVEGDVEMDQPTTTYLFTGQGSQSPGMGMSLYEQDPAARQIWDVVDKHLKFLYGE
jgi:fatty acid synthase subunit beta